MGEVRHLPDEGDHGCGVGDVVHHGRYGSRPPDEQDGQDLGVSSHHVHHGPGGDPDDVEVLQGPDEHEKGREEEDRHPVDLLQGLLYLDRADQKAEGGPGERDGGRLEMEQAMEEEGDQHEPQDAQDTDRQGPVEVTPHGVEAFDEVVDRLRLGEFPGVEEVEAQVHRPQGQERGRADVQEEVVEGEPGRRSDQDVRRVADQGGGPAYVRGEDLREDERQRVQVEGFADGQGDGADQEHRGDVVEEGRDDRRQKRKRDQEPPRVALAFPDGDEGGILDQARLLDDPDEDHHPDQQADRVEVDEAEGVVLFHQPKEEHARQACQGRLQPVHALRHDEGVGKNEKPQGDPLCCRHVPVSRSWFFTHWMSAYSSNNEARPQWDFE